MEKEIEHSLTALNLYIDQATAVVKAESEYLKKEVAALRKEYNAMKGCSDGWRTMYDDAVRQLTAIQDRVDSPIKPKTYYTIRLWDVVDNWNYCDEFGRICRFCSIEQTQEKIKEILHRTINIRAVSIVKVTEEEVSHREAVK
jgi:hypothetical protein